MLICSLCQKETVSLLEKPSNQTYTSNLSIMWFEQSHLDKAWAAENSRPPWQTSYGVMNSSCEESPQSVQWAVWLLTAGGYNHTHPPSSPPLTFSSTLWKTLRRRRPNVCPSVQFLMSHPIPNLPGETNRNINKRRTHNCALVQL